MNYLYKYIKAPNIVQGEKPIKEPSMSLINLTIRYVPIKISLIQVGIYDIGCILNSKRHHFPLI
jgi:hypothetical protein